MSDAEVFQVNELKDSIKGYVQSDNIEEKLGYLSSKLYCVFDKRSYTFLPPFIANNDDEAIRNFENMLNYSQTCISRFPEDFSLLYVCDFVTCITGPTNKLKEFSKELKKYFIGVANGENHVATDTSKYQDLEEGINKNSLQLSNLVKNFEKQVGNVPNLSQQINVINSKIIELSDKLEHLEKSDVCSVPQKKSIIKSLFS